MEIRLGPITGAQRKRLELQEDNHEDNDMIVHIIEALKSKYGGFEAKEKHPKSPLPSQIGFCLEILGSWQPTAHGRSYPTVAGRSRELESLITLLGRNL
ncbi:hypothetical protein M9H77_06874 [Catharanthus roseus]|uniref:Uncharacterized protein n=1 Tax=Catharanthus roseus TaxID=4058 RepID=A0ACC0BTJ0_CATRO|nr:hypothetical protein M9H77_06874 [Catharanthus roseus]